ncbi:protein krueppel-like isoform X2 [Physella acuta]|uniref:protein krueppel-like isoform X2 n=1 Tax=Physella acuta TaxID=109671 RepID=UPI0027DAD71D|nr:protein krueppel-like isoform X2 [Physella acuta]
MDPYPDHGMSGSQGQGPSQSPDLMHDQHLQQLHQSIQQQQQQLHQQLTSGSSSISDLIGMLPQTANLSNSGPMSSPGSDTPLNYRSSSHLSLPTSMYSRHSLSTSGQGSSHSSHQSPSEAADRGEPSISSIAYTRQGDSYVCSLCGKVVVSKAAITRHIQLTHEKKKPFECNICHRRFGYKNILMEHQNIHFGIKPYACTLCDKRFAARSNLFQHRLLHMKPFCCYICNKRFDRDEQLQRHLKLHPTANVLSCSQCPFTATNVEALNQHLQENHKLLTYDTRRHSSSFDSDSGDPPSQVVMSLPSPTLTSPDKSPGHMSLNMDSDAMRRIDTICSQLASRGQSHHTSEGSQQVKQEPLSPGGVRFPPDHHHFPPASPSSRDHHHFNHGSPTSTISNSSIGLSRGQNRLPPFSSALARSYSNPSDPEQGSPLSMTTGRKDTSPILGMDMIGNKYHVASNPRFLPPNRRANSMNSMNPLGSMRHGGPTPEHVRSIADSTSNLSEFFSSLQGLVQRSQEIPELHVNISKPKLTREIGTQYNNTSLPGELPSLEDLLIYYESQGRLYRCQHCRISFEERGLYFLHKSLHGEMSPWQCSICHKICADRNDFHLHFVNQQHRPDQMMH